MTSEEKARFAEVYGADKGDPATQPCLNGNECGSCANCIAYAELVLRAIQKGKVVRTYRPDTDGLFEEGT